MSARHRRRLVDTSVGNNAPSAAAEASGSNDDDDDDDEMPPPRRNQWSRSKLMLDESDTNSDESSDEPQNETSDYPVSEIPSAPPGALNEKNPPEKAKGTSKSRKKKGKQKPNSRSDEGNDQDMALEEALAQLSAAGPEHDSNTLGESASSRAIQPLVVNSATLNIDSELKRKFGAGVDDGAGSGNSGGGRNGGGKSRARSNRRLLRSLFANVRDDWPLPPPFVAGGLRSTKGEVSGVPALSGGVAQLLSFEYSEEYLRSDASFRAIQASGDVESMAAFLAEHPCHTEALLQLAIICLRTGNKDRGADLLRRCLFTYESGCAEKNRLLEGALQLDYQCSANVPLFQALFHQMRCAGMMGCETTALEVGKVLLSLAPASDPMGTLLHLDFYALMSRNFAAAKALTSLDIEFTAPKDGQPGAAPLCIKDLPSMHFSAALAAYESGHDKNEDESTAQATATALLTTALETYPVMLQPLLAACGIDGTARSTVHDWPKLLLSEHFSSQRDHKLLAHLAAVYATRCGLLFKRDDLLHWLCRTAQPLASDATSSVHPSATAAMERFGETSPAAHYLEFSLSEFGDAYEQLPADMNVLDPAILAPQAQAHIADNARMQRRAHRQVGLGGGGGRGAGGGGDFGDELEEQLAAALATGEPLDPNSPLMQLFWQSALPWNHVGTANEFAPDVAGGGGGGLPGAAEAPREN